VEHVALLGGTKEYNHIYKSGKLPVKIPVDEPSAN
jgi:hypothetical protein